jgi:predicted component of type VI protein secretion system
MYLKNFATGVGRKASLVAVELESGKLFKPRLRRIASETGFNRIDIDDEDPYAVEKALSEVDSEISPALEEVIAHADFHRTSTVI